MFSGRKDGYQALPNDDENDGSQGKNGELSFYARSIYLNTKKQLIAQGALPNKAQVAALSPRRKSLYKATKEYYKNIAKKAEAENDGSQDAKGGLSFYSRIIYLITKKQLIATGALPSKAQAANFTPRRKALYKDTKEYYKNIAKKAVKESQNLQYTVQVFRGKSKPKDDLEQNGGPEKLAMVSGAPIMDFIITWFRSAWQVVSNVIANYWADLANHKPGDVFGNDDRDNHNSSFNQIMYKNGDPALGPTPVGIAFSAFAATGFLWGLARGALQILHQITLAGFAYLKKQKKAVNPFYKDEEDLVLEEQLNEDLRQAIKKGIISDYLTLPKRKLPTRRIFIDDIVNPLEEDPLDEESLDESAKRKKRELAQREKEIRNGLDFILTIVSTIWNRLSNYSYVFWLAWMPVVMIAGIAAASGPLMPIILGITLGVGTLITVAGRVHASKEKEALFKDILLAWSPFILVGGLLLTGLLVVSAPLIPILLPFTLALGAAVTIGRLVHYVRTSKKKDAASDPAPADVPDAVKTESDRVALNVKILNFINEESAVNKNRLKIAGIKAKTSEDYVVDETRKEKLKNLLRDQLLGSIHERRGRVALMGFRGFINGLLTVVFVTWFGSALIGALGAIGAATFLGGAPFSGIVGPLLGFFTSFSAMMSLRKEQLEYEQKVNNVLLSSYRGTAETKEDAFIRLYAEVQDLQSSLRSIKGDKDLTEYLDNINPFNPDLSKFRHEASLLSWTGVKKGLNRAFVFLFGGQTGAFLARLFLLKGGLLAGAFGFTVFAGVAFWPFFAIAAGLVLLMAGLAVIDYQMRANQGHREDKLNTLDARLYDLEKKKEELTVLKSERLDKENVDALELRDIRYKDKPEDREEVLSQPLLKSDRNLPPPVASISDSEEIQEQPSLGSDPADAFSERLGKSREPVLVTRSPATFFAPGKLAMERPMLAHAAELEVDLLPKAAAPAA